MPVRTRITSTQLRRAVDVLRSGGLVIYPTESSYALGANATSESAIRRVYQAKGRDFKNPIPVIVADIRMWSRYAYLNRKAKRLIRDFMPGPLTIALKKRSSIPHLLNPYAIAARIPRQNCARKLVKAAGFPITSTSANISGQPAANSVRMLPKSLRSYVDVFLDVGTLPRRKPSTIVDMVDLNNPIITREGAIPGELVLQKLRRWVGVSRQ